MGGRHWFSCATFHEQGIKAFMMSSSLGLSGWILAKGMSIVQAEQTVPAGRPQSNKF